MQSCWTLFPVAFIADSAAQTFSVALKGQGFQDGLVDVLKAINLHGLARQDMHMVIQRCTDVFCERVDSGRLKLAGFRNRSSWHFQVTVPSMRRQAAVVLCPDPQAQSAQTMGLEQVSLCLQFQIRLSSLVVCTAPCSNLELLLERPRLRSLFGGPPPPKDAVLVVTGVATELQRYEAGEWLARHTPALGCLRIQKCLFVSGQTMLAYGLLQNLPGRRLPSPSSAAFDAHREAISICAKAMGLDSCDGTTYDDEYSSLAGKIERSYRSDWCDNEHFGATLESFLDSHSPDVFLHLVREPMLKSLNSWKRQIDQKAEAASLPIEAVALRQAKLEAVLRRTSILRNIIRHALSDGRDAATVRVAAAAEVLSMSGIRLDTPEQQRSFESRLIGATSLDVAHTCMDAVSLFWTGRALTCDIMEGLVFPSRSAAAPLVHEFVAWASHAAAMECCAEAAARAAIAWLDAMLGVGHGIAVRLPPSRSMGPGPQVCMLHVKGQRQDACVTHSAIAALDDYQLAALPVHSIGSSLHLGFWPFSSCEEKSDEHSDSDNDDDVSGLHGSLVDDFEDIWSKADGEVVIFQGAHWCRIGGDVVETTLESIVHEVLESVESSLSEALDSVKSCMKVWQPVQMHAAGTGQSDALGVLIETLEQDP